jgi:DNA-directed RNA polymerase specialized sigma24 family protein
MNAPVFFEVPTPKNEFASDCGVNDGGGIVFGASMNELFSYPDVREVFWEVLRAATPQTSLVLLLRYGFRFPFEEIASELGMSLIRVVRLCEKARSLDV